MKSVPTFTLNNGVKIPCIGTGPGSVLRGKQIKIPIISSMGLLGRFANKVANRIYFKYKARKYVNSIANCLRLGYRLIDYSAAYGSENLIAKAISKSGLKREDVFITSRVTNQQQYDGKVREALLQSLKKLKIDYIDLYMFHWPVTDHFVDTYKEMEMLYKEGYIRALGVCNCHQHHLEKILDECEIVPALDQFEVHPLFTQKPLIDFCKKKGIQVEAYTPLARNDDRLQKNLILKGLCKKYNKDIAQIILRWDYQNKVIPIPRSANPSRQASNIDIFDFVLKDEEMAAIDSININSRLRFDPDNLDFHSVGKCLMGNSYSDVQFKVFDWLRFPLIVGVVFIHCFGKTLDFDAIDFANLSGMDCFNLFRVSISRVLTHICVPVFFLMSGYLFFIGLEKWNNKIFLNKIKKRCKSLLIPYLIWNSVSIFLSLIGIYRHDGFGGVQNFFLVNEYWHLYWDCNVWNMDRLNWIGGGAGASGPYLVPLWFLRNLMVVVLCSPLLYFFFKRLKICGIIILLLCYVSGIFINKPGFSAMAFLFFGAGAYFRMNSINVAQITYKYRLLIYVSAVILWILCTMYNGHNTCIGNIVYPFYVIVGSLALLNISTCIVKKDVLKIPLLLTKSSFFIYLSHCILVVKYALVISEKIFGNTNPILLTVGYLFTPTITVAICVFIFFIINRSMPHLCKVLTGYR